MIFETQRLYVTKWRPDDLNALHELYNDSGIKEAIPCQLTMAETKSIFEKQIDLYNDHTPFGRYFIVEKSSNNFIGIFLLKKDIGSKGVEIGYSLKKNSWKRGYATEVVKAGVDWIFSALGCTSVYAVTDSLNENSKNVLKRCGFLANENFTRDGEELHLFSLELC